MHRLYKRNIDGHIVDIKKELSKNLNPQDRYYAVNHIQLHLNSQINVFVKGLKTYMQEAVPFQLFEIDEKGQYKDSDKKSYPDRFHYN